MRVGGSGGLSTHGSPAPTTISGLSDMQATTGRIRCSRRLTTKQPGVTDHFIEYIDDPKFRRDTDGDGWSDLLENRLGTDPQSRDTDRDGIDDSADRNPLAKSRPSFGNGADPVPPPSRRIFGQAQASRPLLVWSPSPKGSPPSNCPAQIG